MEIDIKDLFSTICRSLSDRSHELLCTDYYVVSKGGKHGVRV